MRDRAVQSFRIALTIIGLILFVVYGTRATSASTDRKVSGIHEYAVVTDSQNVTDMVANSPGSMRQESPPLSLASANTESSQKPETPSATARPTKTTQHASRVVNKSYKTTKPNDQTAKPTVAELASKTRSESQKF